MTATAKIASASTPQLAAYVTFLTTKTTSTVIDVVIDENYQLLVKYFTKAGRIAISAYDIHGQWITTAYYSALCLVSNTPKGFLFIRNNPDYGLQ